MVVVRSPSFSFKKQCVDHIAFSFFSRVDGLTNRQLFFSFQYITQHGAPQQTSRFLKLMMTYCLMENRVTVVSMARSPRINITVLTLN
jgi:hypothetical protein